MADMHYMDSKFETLHVQRSAGGRQPLLLPSSLAAPAQPLSQLYETADDCLDNECEGSWQACAKLTGCEACELGCEAQEELTDAAYAACCTACVQPLTFVEREAMARLMECAALCFVLPCSDADPHQQD
jgi:hypothetical protein